MNEYDNNLPVDLTEGERVLKNWKYAKSMFSNTSQSKLVITNKRIIHIKEKNYKNGKVVKTSEIANDNVTTVGYEKAVQNFKAAGVLFLLMGIIALVFGVVFLIRQKELVYNTTDSLSNFSNVFIFVIAVTFCIFGIIFLLRNDVRLKVVIMSDCRNIECLGINANSNISLKQKTGAIRVKADKNVAEDIVASLGSLLLTK